MKNPNTGVGMAQTSDMKREALLSRLLAYNSLPSTNEHCKRDEVRHGNVVLALKQSAGHGRMGRSFTSAEGGVYVSFCYEPHISPEELLPLTGMCAVAVREAIEQVCGVSPSIKWTNDIVLSGKKICGILAETLLDGGMVKKLIIGIGINLNQRAEDFDAELLKIASSVSMLTSESYDKMSLLLALAKEIDGVYEALLKGREAIAPYVYEYRKYCETLRRDVRVLKSAIAGGKDPREVFAETPNAFPQAFAEDIDDSFALIVRYQSGEKETLFSGEVSIR